MHEIQLGGSVSKSISEIQTEVHNLAKEKGWWDEPREDGTVLMLVVSELAEGLEELRANKPNEYYVANQDFIANADNFENNNIAKNSEVCLLKALEMETATGILLKPEGLASELADAVIRIMDFAGYKGIDLEAMIIRKHEFNKSRAYKHGGKKF